MSLKNNNYFYPLKMAKDFGNKVIIDTMQNTLNLKLIKAIRDKNLEQVKAFLRSGASINSETVEGMPLIVAIQEADESILQWLIQSGADIFQKDKYSKTAIDYAKNSANLQIFTLIKSKLNDSFMAAVTSTNQAYIEELVTLGAEINSIINQSTPLIAAIQSKNLTIVQLLLGLGANVNLPDNDKVSPLMKAASIGNIDIIKLLIAKNANPHDKNKNGENMLFYVLADSNVSDFIKYFIHTLKMNVNETNVQGKTALMNAAGGNRVKATQALLDNGSNPNFRSPSGKTALYFATMGSTQ